MHIRWTSEAAEDLREIVDYIAQSSPGAARRVAREIHRRVQTLMSMEWRGRHGQDEGTHQLVLSPLPYILTYGVIGEGIFILGFRHGARDRR